MKIVAISGALRKASTNTGLLRALKDVAKPGIEVEVVTLHGIPLYDGDVEEALGKPEAVKALTLWRDVTKATGDPKTTMNTPSTNLPFEPITYAPL